MTAELNKLSDKKLKSLHGKERDNIGFFAGGAGLSAKASKAGGISWVLPTDLMAKS
ncbi:conserved hypothetical protein [Xenorhabdus nematophila F1]|nr:conserved hypothetical protein [Xenorhabdus nematophila F1]